MLAQHMITRPVFDALFKEYQFVNNNAVSRSMQDMIEVLEDEGMEMDTVVLDKFYQSVQNNVSEIDNLEAKQTIIKNLYEKFFKGAFPLTVEKLGIVYTPVECVDFIIHSVEDILQEEFHTSLTNENVHILDPFTGTGTFITRLLQSGIIKKEDMLRKYKNEIHCNEIVLLAYYIADVNIEAVFHDIMHPEHYEMYDGICLTDTFQLNEHGDNDIFSQLFPENSERLKKQKNAPVRVIIGNPPYSVGQKSGNDNARNLSYPKLDKRIADTFVKYTDGAVQALYDSYIKAFRWASDRIAQIKDGGIVAFISNGAWLDTESGKGMRKCLQDEYTSIYVFNLRGNQRTSGETSRKEGGKIFGSGSRTPIAITLLVKNPAKKQEKATIYYHDIGDYLTREQKLEIVKKFHSVNNIEWNNILPNEKNDWINQRTGNFDNYIILGDKKNNKNTVFSLFSSGVITHRDVWVYNFNKEELKKNVERLLFTYNKEIKRYFESDKSVKLEDFVNKNETEIKWNKSLFDDANKGLTHSYDDASIRECAYRPYCIEQLYYNRDLNWSQYLQNSLFPNKTSGNFAISITGVGATREFTTIMVNKVADYQYQFNGLCFPLYWFEKNKNRQKTLFDGETGDDYIRRDGITDWILKEVRSRYQTKNITKEMIFYYVYGLLHSEDYRQRFAADLKKSLPRIPIVDRVEDFMDFYKYGKKLADLHLNYEDVPAYEGCDVRIADYVETDNYTAYDHFYVDKMRFKSKDDKSTIIYNGNVVIENIPKKAYEYIVNGKSAIEWIVERYCVSQDKKSLIRNDANDWSKEHGKPRYILDLLLSVINVSVQTVDIVRALPKLKFE